MRIIGLCGGSGSGKSTVAEIFLKHSIHTVSADEVYRKLTSSPSPCLDEICASFGNDAILGGSLNREWLRERVFASDGREMLERLNSITHKYVLSEMRRIAAEYEKAGHKLLVFDVPLLFESGLDKDCFVTVCVLSDVEKRIERTVIRDKLTTEAAKARILSQHTDGWLIKRCDISIYNNGTVEMLEREVDQIIEKIKNMEI